MAPTFPRDTPTRPDARIARATVLKKLTPRPSHPPQRLQEKHMKRALSALALGAVAAACSQGQARPTDRPGAPERAAAAGGSVPVHLSPPAVRPHAHPRGHRHDGCRADHPQRPGADGGRPHRRRRPDGGGPRQRRGGGRHRQVGHAGRSSTPTRTWARTPAPACRPTATATRPPAPTRPRSGSSTRCGRTTPALRGRWRAASPPCRSCRGAPTCSAGAA